MMNVDLIAAQIYNAYPKHVGRGAAIKAIKRAMDKVDADILIERVRKFSKIVEPKRGTPDWKYIPHPCTWFNQERWEDEGIAEESGPKKFVYNWYPRIPRENHSGARLEANKFFGRALTDEEWKRVCYGGTL